MRKLWTQICSCPSKSIAVSDSNLTKLTVDQQVPVKEDVLCQIPEKKVRQTLQSLTLGQGRICSPHNAFLFMS